MTVDLTNCDDEPIHIIGRIQSFGYLLAVSSDWIVTFASGNLAQVVGAPVRELIGGRASDILSEDAIHTLRSRLQLLAGAFSVERIFEVDLFGERFGQPPFDVALHRSGLQIVIEAEPSDTSGLAKYVNTVRPMIERVKQASDTRAMCNMAARQMRALTGFDRVMVYRFAGDGSGEVIGESRAHGIDGFMGMHFPATDIPRQARELYLKNLLRLIADVADPTVTLFSVGGGTNAHIDLTMSTLRAVSPIHIEYLGNMGVAASMSVSIVRDGRLWGLFACHHYQPLKPSYPVRTAAELFAEMFAGLLDQSERRHSQELARKSARVHDKMMALLADGGNLIDHFHHFAAAIPAVIPYDGVAGWIEGKLVSHGAVPEPEQTIALMNFLATSGAGGVWATDCLSRDFAPAAAYSHRCAGLLAVPVSRQPCDFIVLFRREVAMNTPWAGDPEKHFTVGPNGTRLTPRKSFELWNQTVAGHCREWSEDELHCAETIRITLLEVVMRLIEAAAEERERAAREHEFVIAELNHRFRNMLNLVRSLISQSQTSSGSVVEFARDVGNRIESLARAHDQLTDAHHAPVSLHRLIAAEAQAYTGGSEDAAITIAGSDAMIAARAVTALTLVIHELMTNARKYGSLSQPAGKTGGAGRAGRLDIATAREPNGDLVLHWQESGGPAVTLPTRSGFGTTILERSIPHELGGTVSIEYLAPGVVARIGLPAQHLMDGHMDNTVSESSPATTTHGSPGPGRAAATHPAVAGQTSSAGTEGANTSPRDGDSAVRRRFNALVVEDNMLIAMDAEEALYEMGARTVQLCPNVAGALASIASAHDGAVFDVALLDVNLGDETSEAIAVALRAASIPFVMTTGFGDYISDISAYAGAPVLTKPYAPDALSQALAQVMD